MAFSDACWIPFLVGGMLVTGSVNTLAKKIAYQTEADGESWEKPWTCTLIMFFGEMMCLLLFALSAAVCGCRVYRFRVEEGGTQWTCRAWWSRQPSPAADIEVGPMNLGAPLL